MIPVFAPTFVSAGGSTFSPLDLITGNGGFWRADVGVSLSSAGSTSIASWTDQSTFANNLTHVTSATSSVNPPTWSATTWLGTKPGVAFGGGNTMVWGIFPYPATTGSMFVLLFNGTNSFFNSMMSLNTAPLTNNFLIRLDTSSGKIQSTHGSLSAESTSTSYSSGVAYLMGSVADGANLTQWFNGSTSLGMSTADTGTIGGSSASGFPELCIGADPSVYNASGNFHNFNGNIAFAGLTQRIMNATDWSNLKAWANANWGTAF